MKKIITDDMVQKAFDHINNRMDKAYDRIKENQLGNPYINAAFAGAIEELYEIKMSQVPTLDEINDFRGKNEVYVIYEQDYDIVNINAVLTKDKLEEYTDKYAEEHLKKYQDPNEVKSIKKLEKYKNGVTWEIEFTDDHVKRVYNHALKNKTLDDLKRQKAHLTYIGFDFVMLKINEF